MVTSRKSLSETEPVPTRDAYADTELPDPNDVDSHLQDIFERLFDAVSHFAPDSQSFLALCSPMASVCRVDWASPLFATLHGTEITAPLSDGHDLRSSPSGKVDAREPFVGSEIASTLDGLDKETKLKVADGQVMVLRFRVAGELTALFVYWSGQEITQLHQSALRSILELSSIAACATDLTHDLHAQRLTAASLRAEVVETKEFYRQFSESISQCFWVLDLDANRVRVVSDNFEKVWGTSRRVLLDGLTGFTAALHPDDKERAISEFASSARSGNLSLEVRVLDEDGELRWIWLRSFCAHAPSEEGPCDRDDGSGRRLVVIADDITEKKQAEELIRAREAQLVSRAKMLAVGDLASGVAHEINNPLTVIVGKAAELKRMIERGKGETPSIYACAEKIQQTSIRIAEIVTSLKSLSRQEKTASFRATHFAQLFTELRDMVTERFKAHGVKLDLSVFPQELSVEMNSTLISQLILNLLNNALDAVADSKEKWVRVEWTEDHDSVYLYVSDSGPGVPMKSRGRIFDPFFTTKEPGKGTGLGLSLSASIAAHHNGSIRLDNFSSHTCFVVQIPKKQPSSSSSSAAA